MQVWGDKVKVSLQLLHRRIVCHCWLSPPLHAQIWTVTVDKEDGVSMVPLMVCHVGDEKTG